MRPSDLWTVMPAAIVAFLAFTLFSLSVHAREPGSPGSRVRIQVVDSATGASLRPERVTIRSHAVERAGRVIERSGFASHGVADVALENGSHTLSASAEGYHPGTGAFEMQPNNSYRIRFQLDPIEAPEEMRPETLDKLRKQGFMLVQGFVVDEDSGRLLPGAAVIDAGSGVTAITDHRGFFRMHLPAPEEMRADGALTLSKPGYRDYAIYNIEMWSRGDCTYRLRMKRGRGIETLDESTQRRRAPTVKPRLEQAADVPQSQLLSAQMESLQSPEPPQPATLPANATVRIPRNIRVLQGDGVTIDYVSLTYYTRAVLGSEWIASWGDIPGGTNSLNAGAVAVRCYAIAKINGASAASSYDICGTTYCQVYNPARIHSRSDTAVYYTADWILLNGTAIAGTEYSAENNSSDPSLIFGCPDGFTAPDSACLYDPVCAGQVRFGHGRGMCQWGTARWATGRRMNGRSSGDATPTGFPLRDWKWLVRHYYPNLTLVKATALVVGDDVKALKSTAVRACPGGEISSGVNCALLATKSAGATGVIVGGPTVVTSDGAGFTWYQIQWNDASSTTGWSVENNIERVFPLPSAPRGLAAASTATNRIQLNWTDTTAVEFGFAIERAPSASGPWVEIATTPANMTQYLDTNVFGGNTWYYRVLAMNAGGQSAYTPAASATTPIPGPVIASLSPASIPEQQPFTRAATASISELAIPLADLSPFMSETANGAVLIRAPGYSGSTSPFIDAAPNISAVTDAYPTTGHGAGLAIVTRFNVTNGVNPWVRLTTEDAPYYANPVIDLTKSIRFRIYADKPIAVALGCRETTTQAGTPIGADGGGTGAIEWVGVTNQAGFAPMPTRIVPANTWTTLVFHFASEPVRSFSGGNGVLSTVSGLGVLEHVAIVPRAGTGEYKIYLDDFHMVVPRNVAWNLASGAPEGISIDPIFGQIAWVPLETQGPGSYTVGVVATTLAGPVLSSTNLFAITVNEVNRPPVLGAFARANWMVHAGTTVAFGNTASDPDWPANALTYGLEGAIPAGALVNPVTGLFEWPTSPENAGSTNHFLLRVNDDGNPPASDQREFTVAVLPVLQLSVSMTPSSDLVFSWETIPGVVYTVQYRTNLSAGEWQPLTTYEATESGTTSLTNRTDSPQVFYRLKAEAR